MDKFQQWQKQHGAYLAPERETKMPRKKEINVTFTFNIGKPEGVELLNRMVDIHNGGNGSPVKPLPTVTEPDPAPTIEPTAPVAPVEITAPAVTEPETPPTIEPTAPVVIERTAPVDITRDQIGTALQNSIEAIGKLKDPG